MTSNNYSSVSGSRDLSFKKGLGKRPSQEYVYSPLPSATSIRLVEWPQELVPHSDLRFRLRTIDLASSDRPCYSTLSYAWGVDSDFEIEDTESLFDLLTDTVVCEGQYLYVTKNAYVALSEMRWRGRAELIWLDAVCIDQSNLDERSSQVAMMSDIFAKAERTIVWLGEDDEAAQGAYETVQHVANPLFHGSRSPIVLQWVENHVRQLVNSNVEDLVKFKLNTKLPQNILDLLSFLSRPWFQRLWIIQEAVLAQRLWIICGGLTFDWQALIDIAKDTTVERILQGFEDDEVVARGTQGLFAIRLIALLRNEKSSFERMIASRFGAISDAQTYGVTLITLIGMLENCSLSDSRDRIYAPLTLASQLTTAQPSSLLLPDYSISAEHVFSNAALYLLRETGSLAVLGMNKTSDRDNNACLTSWTPDFRVRSAQQPVSLLCTSDATEQWNQSEAMSLRAEIVRSVDFTVLDTFTREAAHNIPLTLEVSGLKFGVIDLLSGSLYETLENDGIDGIAGMIDIASHAYDVAASDRSLPQALFDTLIFGNASTDDPLRLFRPDHDDFLSWLSIKIIRSCMSGVLRLLNILTFVLESEEATLLKFCSHHSIIPVPRTLSERTNCTICRRGKNLKDLSQQDWRRMARQGRGRFDLSLPTVLNMANLIYALVTFSQGSEKAMNTLAKCWLEAFNFDAALRPYITDRSMMVCDQRLGMCPRTSYIGDEIWFLYGSRVPVVLRPLVSGSYEFVGEAYVHGMMKGEICHMYDLAKCQKITLE